MFAYCRNNPVNRIDALGSSSLWWYFIETYDMGFIHRAVQAHIALFTPNVETELFVLGGRADVQLGTAVWEIKHAGLCPEMRIQVAREQAKTYIDGTTITHLGAAGVFSDYFYIKCGDLALLVEYRTPRDGAILYTVKEVKNYEGSYFRIFLILEERKTNQQTMTIPSLSTNRIFSSSGGGGGTTMFMLGMIAGVGCLLLHNYNWQA